MSTANGEKVLVTGGAGYIGSHSVIELIHAGYNVVILDNFVNSNRECIHRVEKIVNQPLEVHNVNILDSDALDDIFTKHPDIKHVIHFAALKAVGESVRLPLNYYKNNLIGTINLLECMERHNVRSFLFSSSATVYGEPASLPIRESFPIGGCTNPYGKSKYFIEEMLLDLQKANPNWHIVVLRYFNPVGAHESGTIGEDPNGIPNNLMPFVSQVAVGRLPEVSVFGNDFDTPDGTGVRDYIHVVDLAKGHVAALRKLSETSGEVKVYNLGTGRGYSVLEMIHAMEKACGKPIKYSFKERRAGDLATVYADTSLAERELGWVAKRNLDDMCADLWRWQENNPRGFANE